MRGPKRDAGQLSPVWLALVYATAAILVVVLGAQFVDPYADAALDTTFVAGTSLVLYGLLRRRAHALQRAEGERDRLVRVVEQAFDSIVITDTRGTIEYVNPTFERVTGYSRDEVIGQNPRILKSGVQSEAFYRDMWATLGAGRVWLGLFVNRRKDGTLFTEDEVIFPLRDATGRVTHYAATKRDVTAERATGEALVREARSNAEISAAVRHLRQGETLEATAAFVCAEVTALPGLNSASVVAFEADGTARILWAVPSNGGGGELPAPSTLRLVKRAAWGPWIEERLTSLASGSPPTTRGTESQAFMPITRDGRQEGLIIAGTTDPDGRAILADRLAMLGDLAAIAGTLLGPGLDARRRASDAAGRIRQTIEERAFRPVFQPIVALASGDVVGYEALTRFTDGAPPDERFAEAEAAGLGLELEAATLREALAAAAQLPPGCWLELNASPAFVLAGEPLARLLGGIGRPIILELTEHDAVTDYAAMRGAIGRLEPGVRFAVDDAGAGFASLRHVLELRPHIVKLDRALVAGIDADPTRQALVAGMQHFAATTTCTLLAEGVETAAEAAMVALLGVQLAQGYLYAHPGPVEEVVRLGGRLPVTSTDPGDPGPAS